MQCAGAMAFCTFRMWGFFEQVWALELGQSASTPRRTLYFTFSIATTTQKATAQKVFVIADPG